MDNLMDEAWVVAGAIIFSAAVTGYFSYKNIKQSKKQTLQNQKQMTEQLKNQNRIASARLAWKLLEYWREEKHAGFTDFMEELYNSKINENDSRIPDVLQIFENIAVFWHEKSLTDNHVIEFFGHPLRIIRESQIMRERITKASADSDLIYANLRPLLEKTREWRI